MKAPGAISLKNINDQTRIGPDLKRSSKEDGLLEIERAFEAAAPLTITYDVKPIQNPYFTEFTYFDFLKDGLYFGSMSAEINARMIEQAVHNGDPDLEIVHRLRDNFKDKYELNQTISSKAATKVVFLPGSNLRHIVDSSKLDRILYDNPEFLIKPHPITTPEGLKDLGLQYGWNRIIDPNESGLMYLLGAEVVVTTANSELSLVANMFDKMWVDVTHTKHLKECSYAPISKMFRELDHKYNNRVMASIFNSKQSGVMFSWQQDIDERIESYIDSVMNLREFFKPRWAGTFKL